MSYNPISDFYLEVSKNKIANHIAVHRFGFNIDIGTTFEEVSDNGGVRPYDTTAQIMTISSDSVNDTSLGSGARTVIITGRDIDYNVIQEEIILDGQTPVLTLLSYLRV